MDDLTIDNLPPEILIEIFTYLPTTYDRQQAALVCKFWRKIGQHLLFTERERLRCTHCSLSESTEPGSVLMQSDRKFLSMRIGKAVKVDSNSRKLLLKLGQSVTDLTLIGTTPWQDVNLIDILEGFRFLHKLEIGSFMDSEINTREFVNFITQSTTLKEVSLHGVKDDFVHYFVSSLKDPRLESKQISLYFPCDCENRDKFDRFIDKLSGTGKVKLIELTVPFKLKALQALAKIQLNISRLTKLEITSPKSFDELKHVCQRMPNLKELVLWRGCLDFQLFDVFDYLINMETLRIQSGIKLTEASQFCENLRPKPRLKTLEVELIEGDIQLIGFLKLIRCLPNLTSLSLSQSKIEDAHLCIVCDNLTNLRELSVDFGCVTDAGMRTANWDNLKYLKKLKISGCHKITDASFTNFPPKLNDLKELRLNYMSQITATAIKKTVQQCQFIEYLSLDGCESIGDEAIEIISANLTRLRQLDLYCCVKVTKGAVDYLAKNCKNLQYLDLSAINLDEEDKQFLYKNIKSLRYIYDYDDGTDMSKYFKGRLLRKRELYLTIQL